MHSLSFRPVSDVELRQRATRIRLVLTDNDGVLTDTGVYYSERGEELKRYSVRDGMGVERLRNAGIETGIITREASGTIMGRAQKLLIKRLHLGVRDKHAQLPLILHEARLAFEQLAYIGDDVHDTEALATVAAEGLTAAPADAMAEARRFAHYQCTARGGHGAFREFAEWILSLRAQ